MSALSTAAPSLPAAQRIRKYFGLLPRSTTERDRDQGDRHTFVVDMFWENSDAFHSEYDVQAMAAQFPQRF